MVDGARKRRWTRRALILGGGTAILGGGALLASRKEDRGGTHDPYFLTLSKALGDAGIAQPTLVIDVNRLDHNIAAARAALTPKALPLRVVVKSLPAEGLINHAARGMATNRFMVFNGAMLESMAQRADADLLLGKPLPALQVVEFLDRVGPDAAARVQWLVDTPERLRQYAEIAHGRGIKLKTNFEIDIGLHRGGFPTTEALAAGLSLAKQMPGITPTGLMGYDPHVPKMFDPDAAYAQSQAKYREAIGAMGETLGIDPTTLTLNGGGSPTYLRHAQSTVANEVSVGSAFAKPVDFDLPTLAQIGRAHV